MFDRPSAAAPVDDDPDAVKSADGSHASAGNSARRAAGAAGSADTAVTGAAVKDAAVKDAAAAGAGGPRARRGRAGLTVHTAPPAHADAVVALFRRYEAAETQVHRCVWGGCACLCLASHVDGVCFVGCLYARVEGASPPSPLSVPPLCSPTHTTRPPSARC